MESRNPRLRVDLRGLCRGRHLRNHSVQTLDVSL